MGKRAKPEEVIAKLREVEVRLSRGETTGQAGRAIGVRKRPTIAGARSMAALPAISIRRRGKTGNWFHGMRLTGKVTAG